MVVESALGSPRRPADPATLAAGFLLATLALAAVAAPLIEAWLGLNATSVDLLSRLDPPSAAHPLARTSSAETCWHVCCVPGGYRWRLVCPVPSLPQP